MENMIKIFRILWVYLFIYFCILFLDYYINLR